MGLEFNSALTLLKRSMKDGSIGHIKFIYILDSMAFPFTASTEPEALSVVHEHLSTQKT